MTRRQGSGIGDQDRGPAGPEPPSATADAPADLFELRRALLTRLAALPSAVLAWHLMRFMLEFGFPTEAELEKDARAHVHRVDVDRAWRAYERAKVAAEEAFRTLRTTRTGSKVYSVRFDAWLQTEARRARALQRWSDLVAGGRTQ